MDFTSRMTALLREMRRERNGAVVDAMRYYGAAYGLNYGVSLPTLRKIARAEQPDHDFARYLYLQDVRELRLAALHIAQPERLSAAEFPAWAAGIVNSEVAEEAAFALLSRSAALPELFPVWIASSDPLLQYAALLAAARSPHPAAAWIVPALDAVHRNALAEQHAASAAGAVGEGSPPATTPDAVAGMCVNTSGSVSVALDVSTTPDADVASCFTETVTVPAPNALGSVSVAAPAPSDPTGDTPAPATAAPGMLTNAAAGQPAAKGRGCLSAPRDVPSAAAGYPVADTAGGAVADTAGDAVSDTAGYPVADAIPMPALPAPYAARLTAQGAVALLAAIGAQNEENRQAVLRATGSPGKLPAEDYVHEELAWRLEA